MLASSEGWEAAVFSVRKLCSRRVPHSGIGKGPIPLEGGHEGDAVETARSTIVTKDRLGHIWRRCDRCRQPETGVTRCARDVLSGGSDLRLLLSGESRAIDLCDIGGHSGMYFSHGGLPEATDAFLEFLQTTEVDRRGG